MRVNVRYFAVVRERLGRETETVEVGAGADVRAALDALVALHPELGPLRGHVQVAVNQTMVKPDHALADGDELALIPPVAGGAGERTEPAPRRSRDLRPRSEAQPSDLGARGQSERAVQR